MKIKKITKAIVTVITVGIVAVSFTGCTNQLKGTCEACGKTAPLYKFTATASIMGYSDSSSYNLCKDCCDKAKDAIASDGLGITTYTCEPIKK